MHLPDRWLVDYAYAGLPDADHRIDNFTLGMVSVLVATTVVECGIDVARLNTIIIQDAVRVSSGEHVYTANPTAC